MKTKERTMQQGTVNYFYLAHNFGFIKSDAGSDIFVHGQQVTGGTTLVAGQRVEFEDLTTSSGTPAARNVRVIDGTAASSQQLAAGAVHRRDGGASGVSRHAATGACEAPWPRKEHGGPLSFSAKEV